MRRLCAPPRTRRDYVITYVILLGGTVLGAIIAALIFDDPVGSFRAAILFTTLPVAVIAPLLLIPAYLLGRKSEDGDSA